MINSGNVRNLNCIQQISYGLGHVLNDLCASQWFSYFLLFFHLVLKFSSTLSGSILLTGQIADGISTLFVGFEIDQINSLPLFKYGQRKTWHLIGTFCVAFSFPFIFRRCIGGDYAEDWAKAFYYCMFVIVLQFGWASVQISHLSLIPHLSADEHERSKLTAIRYACTAVSNITVFVIAWLVLGLQPDKSTERISPEYESSFQIIVFSTLGIGIVASIIFHLGVHEKLDESVIVSKKSSNLSFWFRKYPFYFLGLLYMGSRLYVNLTQIYLPLYLQETLNLPSTSVAILPLIVYVNGLIASLIFHSLYKVIGKKISYLLGSSLGIGACFWVWFGKGLSYQHIEIYFATSLMGFASSSVLVTSLALMADFIVVYNASGGFLYGTMSFLDKLSNGIAVMILQYFHSFQHSCSGPDSFYQIILSLICGCCLLLALSGLFCLSLSDIKLCCLYPNTNASPLINVQEVS